MSQKRDPYRDSAGHKRDPSSENDVIESEIVKREPNPEADRYDVSQRREMVKREPNPEADRYDASQRRSPGNDCEQEVFDPRVPILI